MLLLLFLFLKLIQANTEIRHVSGPPPFPISTGALASLRSNKFSFPNTAFLAHYAKTDVDNPSNKIILNSSAEQWYVLDTIPSQKYEIRISYPAINPSDFEIDTFDLSTLKRPLILKDSGLVTDVSILFVRIRAIATGISNSKQEMVGYNIVADEMLWNHIQPVVIPLLITILGVVFLSWFTIFPFFEKYILSVLIEAYQDDLKHGADRMDIWTEPTYKAE